MKIHLKNLPVMLGVFMLRAHPAWAEVMDKEPGMSQIWLWVFVASVGGFLICRLKPLWGMISFIAISCYLFSVVTEMADPGVGQLMRHEAGAGYFWQLCLSFTTVIFAHVLGAVFYRRYHHQRSLT